MFERVGLILSISWIGTGDKMIYSSEESEKNAIMQVAHLMLAAARTAPKGKGVDNIETLILEGEDKDALAEKMREISKELNGEGPFERDSFNVDNSECVVLIGVKHSPLGMKSFCGMCGFDNCDESAKAGASCGFNISDLGIAVGSAASIAADNRIDNRVMFSIGKAAISKGGLFSENVRAAYGFPLSTSGKSIYFDR